jgi:beta-phosphoglucomutase
MQQERVDAVFVDFNGPTKETDLPWYRHVGHVYRQLGLSMDVAVWNRLPGHHAGDVVADLVVQRPDIGTRRLTEMVRNAERATWPEILDMGMRPETLAFVRQHRRAGAVVGVVTSASKAWIAACGADHFLRRAVHFVVTADDVGPSRVKPHPDQYLAAMEHARSRPEHTVIVEDSLRGVAAGLAATNGRGQVLFMRHDLNRLVTLPAGVREFSAAVRPQSHSSGRVLELAGVTA